MPNPVIDAALDDIVDLLPLTHNENAIEAYRQRMAAGDEFPPIAVLPLFGRMVITDGHKRYQAARRVPLHRIRIEVWTWRDLAGDQWRQVRANARKNGRIARALFTNPSEAVDLVRDTLVHWRRVGRCLALLLRERSR